MLRIMRDPAADPELRARMAAAAAPYVHPRRIAAEVVTAQLEIRNMTAEQRLEYARQLIARARDLPPVTVVAAVEDDPAT
jgi:hypothetical protein